VLVSCPCNVPQWRASRKRSAWSNSESPHSYVGKVDPKLRLIAITGANDSNTRTSLARSYVADLQRRGVEARFVEAPNAGHGYDNLAATVQSELGKLLAQ
jgi:dipeptidyl aminopeptidase/acylaminoacyl peptidase